MSGEKKEANAVDRRDMLKSIGDVPDGTLRIKNALTRGMLAGALAFVLVVFIGPTNASAQEKPSSEADIKAALFGGVPMGRWKEGLLYEGISPQPWLKSAANWFPRTENVQPNEMRIIFMGSAPMIRPGQMNTSIMVQLGNGENFIFDLGEGSVGVGRPYSPDVATASQDAGQHGRRVAQAAGVPERKRDGKVIRL